MAYMAFTAMLKEKFTQRFTPRKLRFLRESLTGYLFIAPAVILIFIFGIFPVAFALYVSLQKWKLKQTGFIGLTNYVKGMGNLTYALFFVFGIGLLLVAFRQLIKIIKAAKEDQGLKVLWLALPGMLHGAVIFTFFRFLWFQLPEFLAIADKIRVLEKTRENFMILIRESFQVEVVHAAWIDFRYTFLAALVVGILLAAILKWKNITTLQIQFMQFWLSLGAGAGLLWFTYSEIINVYTLALEEGTDPGIWPQVITILSGLIPMILGFYLWNSASNESSNKRFWLKIFGALTLLVGGWILVGEIPAIVAAGDKDLWTGLKVTIFFSLGTVPFQLSIAMFLAILLFQKLKGSGFFRMVFFLPYVTPFIASAAVFKQMFSMRETSPINLLLRNLGLEAQMWLMESKGIFEILADSGGFSIPAWAAGPSLALCVIILHSIWSFVGYNTVIYLAGLGNISPEIKEAAQIDGANRWDTFRHITFPLLSPTTYFLSLIAVIGTFKAFATLWVFRESLALGTTETFSLVIFVEFFEKARYGYASALAFILFAVILALTFLNNRIQGSRVFYG
jgi:ABC-type sugar transport system permease subunit